MKPLIKKQAEIVPFIYTEDAFPELLVKTTNKTNNEHGTIKHLNKLTLVEKFKSKQFRSVELVAFDTLTDYAVQLAIMIKSEMQHGLHQTTNVALVQGN